MTLAGLIEKHGATALIAIASIYGGFVTGQVTTENRLKTHDDQIAELKRVTTAQSGWIACATRQLDWMHRGTVGEAPCVLGGM